MTDLDDHGRPEPPLTADETGTLLGFLDYQRATLAWKCAGVDAAGLKATVAASSMTLGGLLKHLAYVEDLWFSPQTAPAGGARCPSRPAGRTGEAAKRHPFGHRSAQAQAPGLSAASAARRGRWSG